MQGSGGTVLAQLPATNVGQYSKTIGVRNKDGSMQQLIRSVSWYYSWDSGAGTGAGTGTGTPGRG
jgi:hypothetical protein